MPGKKGLFPGRSQFSSSLHKEQRRSSWIKWTGCWLRPRKTGLPRSPVTVRKSWSRCSHLSPSTAWSSEKTLVRFITCWRPPPPPWTCLIMPWWASAALHPWAEPCYLAKSIGISYYAITWSEKWKEVGERGELEGVRRKHEVFMWQWQRQPLPASPDLLQVHPAPCFSWEI